MRINILLPQNTTQKEENYSIVELIDKIIESNFFLKLIKDDFLDEPIEETQVQEVNALLDSSHASHPPNPQEFFYSIFDPG